MPVHLQTVDRILLKRQEVPLERSLLVGVTGIDGSGKGYLTVQIVNELAKRGVRAANIGVDGWLNLPSRRFNPENPAEHFHAHAIRFEGMFEQLIEPLIKNRSLRLVADFTNETVTRYRKHTYQFENIDIVVLEGIFPLKPAPRRHFDLTVWDLGLPSLLVSQGHRRIHPGRPERGNKTGKQPDDSQSQRDGNVGQRVGWLHRIKEA